MKDNQKVVWAVIIALHAAFLCYGGNIYLKDSADYLHQAENIFRYGTWYCGDASDAAVSELFSQRTPLYGFFIGLIHKVSTSAFVLRLIQTLLSLFNIAIAFRVAARLSARLQLPAALIALAAFPSQMIYANMVMSEMLAQTFVIAAAWFALKGTATNKPIHFTWHIIAVTLAMLTKPVFAGLLLIPVILFVLYRFRHRPALFMLLLIPVLTLCLVAFVNYLHTGKFEYSSIARKLAINYHALNVLTVEHGHEAAVHVIDSIQQKASAYPYPVRAKLISSAASEIIFNDLGTYSWLTVKGIIRFFCDHSRYDLEAFAGRIPDEKESLLDTLMNKGFSFAWHKLTAKNPLYILYLALSILVNTVLLAGFLRFSCSRNIAASARIIVAGIVFYTAFATGMTGSSRFRVPVFPLIVAANVIVLSRRATKAISI